jgi:hypothetical protein
MVDKAPNQLTLLTGELDDDDVFVVHRGDETTGVTYRIPRDDLVDKLGISGGGISYTDKSAAFTMVAGEGYKTTHDSTKVAATLPASPAVNDIVAVAGEGDAGWEIKSNASAASQKIVSPDATSGTSQNSALPLAVSDNQYDSMVLLCVVGGTNSVWAAIGGKGGVITEFNYFGDGSDGNKTVASNENLSSTVDGDILVKNYNSLQINSGYTLSVANRCRGLLIYVKGDCTINGTLSMTGKGAYANPTGVSSTGLRLPMVKDGSTQSLSAADFAGSGSAVMSAVAHQPGIDGDGKIYVIEKVGGSGGARRTSNGSGYAGGTKANGTGGGGGGGYSNGNFNPAEYGGAGGAGTCWSGGAGGGGGDYYGPADDGAAYGGPGGDVATPGSNYLAGGGAGNPGGTGAQGAHGQSGTGGLLILIVGGNLTIGSSGSIQAKGKNGGGGGSTSYDTGGGGSGGGNVLTLYAGILSNSGTLSAAGGSPGNVTLNDGGAGGAGTVTLEQVNS